MQIAIGTNDVYKTAEVIKLSEGKVTREPGPLPGINTKITACVDPDGWKFIYDRNEPVNEPSLDNCFISAVCFLNAIIDHYHLTFGNFG